MDDILFLVCIALLLSPLYMLVAFIYFRIISFSSILKRDLGNERKVPQVDDNTLRHLISQYEATESPVWNDIMPSDARAALGNLTRDELEKRYLTIRHVHDREKVKSRVFHVAEIIADTAGEFKNPLAIKLTALPNKIKNIGPSFDEALILASNGNYSGLVELIMDLI